MKHVVIEYKQIRHVVQAHYTSPRPTYFSEHFVFKYLGNLQFAFFLKKKETIFQNLLYMYFFKESN
jgi:hypothetical protein